MLSGGKAGLVSLQDLRKEQEENRRMEKKQPLEGLFSFSPSRVLHDTNLPFIKFADGPSFKQLCPQPIYRRIQPCTNGIPR